MLKTSLKNKVFVVGFALGIIIVALLNYFSYMYSDRPDISHAIHTFGFPFSVYQYGGYSYNEEILWTGLIGTILIAFGFSFAMGKISDLIWKKVTSN